MATILDLSGITPNYSQAVDLDGATFTLGFNYRTRDDSWTIDIDDASGTPVIHGVKLTAGTPILHGCVALNRPLGELIVIDSTKKDLDPGLNDLGGLRPRCYIGYLQVTP